MNKLFLTNVTYTSISRKEFDDLKKNAIKKWHFGKTEGGFKPMSDEDVKE